MKTLPEYERAKLTVTVFDDDQIHTDRLAGSSPYAPIRTSDMLPIFSLGAPVSGIGGSAMDGDRNSFG